MNLKPHNPFRLGVRGLAALVLATALFARAQSTDDSSTTSSSSFDIIAQRNIFNPNRYGSSGYRPVRRGAPTFSLTGTMSYRQGMFAFFDGTSADYHKVIQEGGTIAGYKVTNITFSGAQLQGGGKPIAIKVGGAMRQDGDNWILSEPGQWDETSVSGAATETPSSPNAAGASPSAPSPAGQPNDVLRRLMEKRQQELK